MRYSILTMFLMLLINSCNTPSMEEEPIPQGVSLEIAEARKSNITEVEYGLFFNIPEKKEDSIPAMVSIDFLLKETNKPLIIDFNTSAKNIKTVSKEDKTIEYDFQNGHIIIPITALQKGKNHIKIDFIAGEQSLNRSEDFLYTLLVPDRASTVFPCFDQPDIKARFRLRLKLPKDWVASGNGALEKRDSIENHFTFKQTKPFSTYLFAFAAGKFQTITQERDGRTMTMYHRETDQKKVERNVDAIFDLHASSLDWLEEYTDIMYPFGKFDFVLIPPFQYGGMEHVGNIFYRASSLFLEESATEAQKLSRASLIAHETAHKWFGNLVTMKWFNDVWLKEVFANFMAAKIVNPNFPKINHDLRFMLAHHPSAYGEDRTGGSHPIQQPLENLSDAGTLYGRIIYQKAPVVMKQLETTVGEDAFRDGLREYLKEYRFDNAVWDDLIHILDEKSDADLKGWSNAWVKKAGMPEAIGQLREETLTIKQLAKTAEGNFWSQQIDVQAITNGKVTYHVRATVEGESTEIPFPKRKQNYDFLLLNGSELGYGYFALDTKSQLFLLDNIQFIRDDVVRGAAWLTLYEAMVRGQIDPSRFIVTLQNSLLAEDEPLNRQNLLNQLQTTYWKFLTLEQRQQIAPEIEVILWKWIDARSVDNKAKSAFYKTLKNVALTESTIQSLYEIWEKQEGVSGLTLSENDYTILSYELALRLPKKADAILSAQLDNIQNKDRKKRFTFVKQALSASEEDRDAFFESLKKAENRHYEPWVVEAVGYLHHPLRAGASEKYVLPSLELLEEIQMTGDIFFPKRWLVATFNGHQSKTVAITVKQFLDARPHYSYRLKNKILQAADMVIRVGK